MKRNNLSVVLVSLFAAAFLALPGLAFADESSALPESPESLAPAVPDEPAVSNEGAEEGLQEETAVEEPDSQSGCPSSGERHEAPAAPEPVAENPSSQDLLQDDAAAQPEQPSGALPQDPAATSTQEGAVGGGEDVAPDVLAENDISADQAESTSDSVPGTDTLSGSEVTGEVVACVLPQKAPARVETAVARQTETAGAANTLSTQSAGAATATTKKNPYAAQDEKALASKGTLKKGIYLLVGGTTRGKVLGVADASKKAGAITRIWDYATTWKNQRWKVVVGSDGYATIISVNSGMALTVSGGKAKAGAKVVQAKNTGKRSQKWIVTQNKNGTYRIESALKLGYSLNVKGASKKNGAVAELRANTTGKAQRWTFQKLSPKVAASDRVKAGWYTLKSILASGYTLAVKSLSGAAGTKVVLKKGTSIPGSAFKLKKVGNYYRIVAGVAQARAVEVASSTVLPGASVDIWKTKASAKGSLYSLQYDKKLGGYRLVNVATGLALSVTGGKAADGAKVTGEHAASTVKAQVFTLEKRPGLLDEGIYSVRTTLKGKRAVSAYGTKAEFSRYDKEFEQKWQVVAVAGKANTYTFESLATGKRLTGAENAQARIRKASSSNVAQQWIPTWTGKGFALKNASTKKTLSVSGKSAAEGARVVNKNVADVASKTFTLKRARAVESGTYSFMSYANTAYSLDVPDWSKSDGTRLIIWDSTGYANQQWAYDAAKHTLTNVHSGKLLDIASPAEGADSRAMQHAATGGKSQKWTIAYDGAGKFKVVSGAGNAYVLTASETAENGLATVAKDTGSKLQRWRFTSAAYDASYSGFTLVKSIVSNGHGRLKADYVCIHETANPGATALNHVNYWSNDDTYAVHYTLDWTGNCYYCVPENRLCWQVGNGNDHVVGIELCHATNSADFSKVWKAGVQWAAWQLKKNGWGIDRLLSHDDCRKKWGGTDHTDPIGYFQTYGKTWGQFKDDVRQALS